jgi:uncharacterized protein YjdB
MAKTAQLTPTIAPTDASDKTVTWASDDTGVATVNSSGLVTGVGEGTCTITCATTDGEFEATCDVTVTAILITSLTLNATAQTIDKGETFQLTPTIAPTDASIKEVEWLSSDTDIATVSAAGLVTAVAGGSCTISCAATDGSGKTAECAITVNVPVTGVSVSPTTLELNF